MVFGDTLKSLIAIQFYRSRGVNLSPVSAPRSLAFYVALPIIRTPNGSSVAPRGSSGVLFAQDRRLPAKPSRTHPAAGCTAPLEERAQRALLTIDAPARSEAQL